MAPGLARKPFATCTPDFSGAAYTTLMTTMERLHRKGILARERAGRAFVYEARFSREALETAAAARALGLSSKATAPVRSCRIWSRP